MYITEQKLTSRYGNYMFLQQVRSRVLYPFEYKEALLPEESLGARVHAGGGLVQQHNLRLAHHAHRVAQLETQQHARHGLMHNKLRVPIHCTPNKNNTVCDPM